MTDHEAVARAVKATRIADLLSVVQADAPALTADVLAASSPAERHAFALAAGFRAASDATWEQVVAILRDREAQADQPLPGPVQRALDRMYDRQIAKAGGSMPS